MDKKAQFGNLSNAMIGLGAFFLVVVVIVLMIAQTKDTSIVCSYTRDDGDCVTCPTDDKPTYNTSDNLCHNETAGTSASAIQAGGYAHNASIDMQDAAAIAPQFSPVVVVAVIGFALIGLFGGIAYNRRR